MNLADSLWICLIAFLVVYYCFSRGRFRKSNIYLDFKIKINYMLLEIEKNGLTVFVFYFSDSNNN